MIHPHSGFSGSDLGVLRTNRTVMSHVPAADLMIQCHFATSAPESGKTTEKWFKISLDLGN